MRHHRTLFFATTVWLALVIASSYMLITYEFRGLQLTGSAPTLTATMRDLTGTTSEFSLFVFVHPRCPCSRATISELSRLMANCNQRLRGYVLFFHPSDEPSCWSETDLWRSAAAVPGITVHKDLDGQIAQQVGASLSGHALLYSRRGKLLFAGGLTQSRGHEGNSRGRMFIAELVNRGTKETVHPYSAPTFGCEIYHSAMPDTHQGE